MDSFGMHKLLGASILAALAAQLQSGAASAHCAGTELRLADPTPAVTARAKLGRSVFETQWAPAGSAPGDGRVGLGPLFNATSCNTCHVGGHGGSGPRGDGPTPAPLVIHLESAAPGSGPQADGDPVYGRVLNTSALHGVQIEGIATVRYTEIDGYYYPYGPRWSLRVPHYQITGLSRGPLAATTVIKPRLAPALFGVGLLEAVPQSAIDAPVKKPVEDPRHGIPAWQIYQGKRVPGRLGWQAAAVSVRDQTTKALSQDMGLTTDEHADDDCTIAEADCQAQPSGGRPEVAAELVDALVEFQRTLAIPQLPLPGQEPSLGAELFDSSGCPACHRPRLPVQLTGADGAQVSEVIAAYTDLRLHDLGSDMADETAAGVKVQSRWRTAPLWGLGYRMKRESHPTFLHDGRARSTEEAVLWHTGEASNSKRRFVSLGPRARAALLRWIETL